MKRASISEAKSHFSSYLNDVEKGETVLIYDRDKLVARLEPARHADIPDAERVKALVKSGVASSPRHPMGAAFLKRPRPRLPQGVSGSETLVNDRDSR
jgi:antitoxin (DNA-binding transcriptional repressor) of toxin-antitoxin stability system